MAMSSGNGDEALSDINVTPLVDVMLVLLIIFMVTAPALTTGVNVELPEASAEAMPAADESVIVTMTAKGKLYIGETEVPRQNLEEKIAAIFGERTDREVFVRADQSVPYGKVVKLLADLKAAGIAKVGMVTREEEIKRP